MCFPHYDATDVCVFDVGRGGAEITVSDRDGPD